MNDSVFLYGAGPCAANGGSGPLSMTIDNSEMGYCSNGLAPGTSGTFNITNSLIHNTTGIGIFGAGTTLNVNYCVIRNVGSYGFYGESGTAVIKNSLFYNNGANSVYANSVMNLTMKNNIIYTTGFNIQVLRVATTATYAGDYNLFWNSGNYNFINYKGTIYTRGNFATYQTASDQDTHSLVADPLFANAAGNDFTLQASSLAINAGTDVSLTSDYLGTVVPQGVAPDIGAYEYDVTGPALSNGSNISLTNDTTPNFTFTSDEAGTISYSGDCSSSQASADAGSNIITFGTLSAGTHSNCSIAVADPAGNVSDSLSVSAFTIDNTAPTITGVNSDKTNGSYTTGEVIDVDITFSEAVTSTGNITVTLETGDTDRTCTFTMTNATAGTCNYTVQAGDTASDLTVKTIAGTIADQAGNAMTNFVPTTNLAANKALIIDTTAPAISDISPDGTTFSISTTNTDFTITTSETSTCKYGTGNTAYGSLPNTFTNTDSTAHSTNISNLDSGNTYTYHIKCQDAAGNASSDSEISFSIAPEENKTSLNSVKIKINKSSDKVKGKILSLKNKFRLKGEDDNLANGEVKFYKNNKFWKSVSADASGAWDKILKLKDSFSGTIKIRQYDQFGTLLNTKKVKMEIDTEKPKFTKFNLPWRATRELTKLTYEAQDDDKIDKYKIYVGGRIYTTKYNTFQIPRDASAGLQKIQIWAYDEAGNMAMREAFIWVK